jgi:hypothetical protein
VVEVGSVDGRYLCVWQAVGCALVSSAEGLKGDRDQLARIAA